MPMSGCQAQGSGLRSQVILSWVLGSNRSSGSLEHRTFRKRCRVPSPPGTLPAEQGVVGVNVDFLNLAVDDQNCANGVLTLVRDANQLAGIPLHFLLRFGRI